MFDVPQQPNIPQAGLLAQMRPPMQQQPGGPQPQMPPQGQPGPGPGPQPGMQAPPRRPQIGLARNPPGVPFQCGTCQFFQRGVCANPDPALRGKQVDPAMCCDLYQRPGMQTLIP